jgi:MFS family permease
MPNSPKTELIPADPGYVQGYLKWAIALTASLGAILEVIDTSIVNVALTDVQASLGATVSEVGWIVSGYGIANVIMIPLSAWLGDYLVYSGIGAVWIFGEFTNVGAITDRSRLVRWRFIGEGTGNFV